MRSARSGIQSPALSCPPRPLDLPRRAVRRPVRGAFPRPRASSRRGVVIPLVAVALVAVAAGMALVLQSQWVDSALEELDGACEAAALAAARELACDDLLRGTAAPGRRLENARRAAVQVAAQNLVSGRSLVLDAEPGGGVWFGRRVINAQSGRAVFLETPHEPTTVLVTGRPPRAGGLPMAFRFIQPGDELPIVEATIDNRVVAVRPFAGVPVPALPLALLKEDPAGARTDTWTAQIEGKQGEDRFAWEPESGRVRPGSDGLPEIILRSMPAGGHAGEANVQLVDLGTDFLAGLLEHQIRNGWRAEDLSELGGTLAPAAKPLVLTSSATIAGDLPRHLQAMIGRCRIVLLYRDHRPQGARGFGVLTCAGLAAGRIMAVRTLADGACEIVFQPGVLTTRTALLAGPPPGTLHSFAPEEARGAGLAAAEFRNPYIYKVQRTR